MPGTVEPELPLGEDEAPHAELPIDNTPPRTYVVLKQSVHLDIDLQNKAIQGRADIMIAIIEDVSDIYIDARQCEIETSKITVSGCATEATYVDPCGWLDLPSEFRWSASQWGLRKRRIQPLLHHRRTEISALDHDLKCCQPNDGSLRVKMPTAKEIKQKNKDATKNELSDHVFHEDGSISACTISIPFKLKGVTDGLHFVGCDEADTRYPHVYTRHSAGPGTASSIFPCIDDPGCRNPWKVSITCPRTLGDAFRPPKSTQYQQKGGVLSNGVNGVNRKRKHGQEEPAPAPRREVRLTEDDKLLELTVVCTGYMTGDVICKDDETKKTMTFEIDKAKAAKHIGFAVGPFEHVDLWSEFRTEEDDIKLNVSAVKVHGYCLPGREEEVKNTCATLVTAVDYFVLQFGRFPFDSYKVCFVDDMVDDTVPLCAFSLCSSRLLYPREVIDTEVETTRTLVYALASQWFGINIGPNQRADIWLIVGIAWFMTDIFMKFLCGNNEYRFRMKTMADRLVQLDIKRPSLHDLGDHLYLGDFEVDFMNLKAPLVLFILDRRISKSSSSAGLMRIISKIVGKANISSQASDEVLMSELFRKACEKALGTRLDTFWTQWIQGSGCPRFDVFQRFNKKRLCVEMTIRQTQDIAAAKTRPLEKDEFWREVMEDNHAVYAGELQGSFTGPMTIRIHEADGTPYEHIVDIREDSGKASKFEIPYNTKYKRLKRNRRQRERQMAGLTTKTNEDAPEENLALYSLGDVLQQQEEADEWRFIDWDEEQEARMDLESYEWIRMDADFEWICDIKTNLPAYMYVSQLQQDKDVVAQQDSMLFLDNSFGKTGAHPLVSTILTRTLLDARYYYGIRTMSAKILPKHAVNAVDNIGLFHLRKTFQHFFCISGTDVPRPNNFSDKRQYLVQCAIPTAIAQVRGDDGQCPREARHFILAQLQGNDNSENMYSDHVYIATLIRALAQCQVPDEKKVKPKPMSMSFGDGDEDEFMEEAVDDTEPRTFRDRALDEIERFRRMDEYYPSYQNCFTVASLDALCTLMKAKVIDKNPVVFLQYLPDKTLDLVRIKACECLIELGLLANATFLRFLLSLVGTDPSPYVRAQLFKALCRGLAGIAIGENMDLEKPAAPPPADDGLIVEHENTMTEERQKARARKEDLTAALAALKEEMKDDETLHEVIWEAISSSVLTVPERVNLLELVSILVEDDDSMLMTFKYPTYWTVDKRRNEKVRRSCVMHFKRHFRLKSRKKYTTPASAPRPPEPKRTITLNLNKAPSFNSKAATPGPAPAPIPAVPQPTAGAITVPAKVVATAKPAVSSPVVKAAELPRKQSITASPVVKASSPAISAPPPPPSAPTVHRDSISVSAPARTNGDRPAVPEPKPAATTATVKIEAPPKPLPSKPPPPKSLPPKPLPPKPLPTKPLVISTDSPKPSSVKIGLAKTSTPKVSTPKFPSSSKLDYTPSTSGNGSILANPKKRPNPDAQNSGRPRKIIKLNTSKISSQVEQILRKPKPRKIVRLKFRAWDKLKRRKDTPASISSSVSASAAPSVPGMAAAVTSAPYGSGSSSSGHARAMPKHSAVEKTSSGGPSGPSPRSSPGPSLGRLFSNINSSKKKLNSSSPGHSRSSSLSSPKFTGGNSGSNGSGGNGGNGGNGSREPYTGTSSLDKHRKALPDSGGSSGGAIRKALPDSHRKALPSGERRPLPGGGGGGGSGSSGTDRGRDHYHGTGSSGGAGRDRDRDRDRGRDDYRKPLPGSHSNSGNRDGGGSSSSGHGRPSMGGSGGSGDKAGTSGSPPAPKIKFKVKAPGAQ